MEKRASESTYTCADYRLEMMLLGLTKQLQEPGITPAQKTALEKEIRRLQRQLGMD